MTELAKKFQAVSQKLSEYDPRSMTNVEEQIHMIESGLQLLKEYLTDTAMKQRKDRRDEEMDRMIRDAIYEAEDIIDSYLTHAAKQKHMKFIRRATYKSINLHGVNQKFHSICQYLQIYAIDLPMTTEEHRKKERILVGLDEEIQKVIGYLKEETEELDVITIVGMPGIGKTTLALETYYSKEIKKKFPTRIWINVSNNFSERDLFLTILKNCTMTTDDFKDKSQEELANLVAANLRRKKFLIVMDDVWSVNDWDRLRIALPESNKNGRVLITSYNEEVGRHANRLRLPHKVCLLTPDDSLLLLRTEVFGNNHKYPPELADTGKLIVEQCGGLPQAILAVARTLVLEDLASSNTILERRIAWTKAGFGVPHQKNIIFYQSLPYHLRPCFLYFGMFPYDFEIPVWRLIRMWIAEGLILQNGGISLEDTAETYLDNLISRNLVEVCRNKSDGRVKTCRIPRVIHEFCKVEAGNERENFLQEIKFAGGVCEPQMSELSNYRRLCIHSNALDFFSSNIPCPGVRSFVSFSEREVAILGENVSAITKAYKLIRVFDVQSIKFQKTPSDIFRWLHLRYLVISIKDISFLPRYISKLLKIQTLVVYTLSRSFEFKGDIFEMTELRHFKTNASTILASHGKTSTHSQQLQTLGWISTESCTKEFLERACNLKKVGICGKLSAFCDDSSTGSFESLARLWNLENLKLRNDDVYHLVGPEGGLVRLLSGNIFAPTLISLTLASTYLQWRYMRILGLLVMLKILKLKDHAFKGSFWRTDDFVFHKLEALYIKTNDLHFWDASANQFPRLRRLKLHRCRNLREVPYELAYIPTFQHLELRRTTSSAADSARKIENAIKTHRNREWPNKNAREFKLSIIPNDDHP